MFCWDLEGVSDERERGRTWWEMRGGGGVAGSEEEEEEEDGGDEGDEGDEEGPRHECEMEDEKGIEGLNNEGWSVSSQASQASQHGWCTRRHLCTAPVNSLLQPSRTRTELFSQRTTCMAI